MKPIEYRNENGQKAYIEFERVYGHLASGALHVHMGDGKLREASPCEVKALEAARDRGDLAPSPDGNPAPADDNGEEAPDFDAMTKAQIEAHGRTLGVELDKRKTKAGMIEDLQAHMSAPVEEPNGDETPGDESAAEEAPDTEPAET